MSRQFIPVVTLAVGALTLVKVSEAQVTQTFPTIEARIHQARQVVCGRITDLRRTVILPQMGRLSDGTTLPDGIAEYQLTVAVDERFRGSAKKRLVLRQRTSVPDRRFDDWKAARTEFLWFIQDPTSGGPVPPAQWNALRLDPPVAVERFYTTDGLPVFSMDLSVVRDRKAALEKARAFSAQHSRGHELLRLTISHAMSTRVRPSADANYLTVPQVPHLATVARQLIRSPDRVRDSDAAIDLTSQLRVETLLLGLEMLRPWKSKQNIRLLRDLSRTSQEDAVKAKAQEILSAWHAPAGTTGTGTAPAARFTSVY